MDPLVTLEPRALPPPAPSVISDDLVFWDKLPLKVEITPKVFPDHASLIQMIWQFDLAQGPLRYMGKYRSILSRRYEIQNDSPFVDLAYSSTLKELAESLKRTVIGGNLICKTGFQVPIIYLLSLCYNKLYCYSPMTDHTHQIYTVGIGRKDKIEKFIETIGNYITGTISIEKAVPKEFKEWLEFVRRHYVRQITDNNELGLFRAFVLLDLPTPPSGVEMTS